MQKLHPGHIEGSQENLAILLDAWNISDFTYEPINQGMENSSFRIESGGESYVLRVYRHNKKESKEITFEIAFQDFLREKGIPIPSIYPVSTGAEMVEAVIDGKTWQAILMEFVEGSSHINEYTPQLSAELAAYQSTMHLLGMEYAQRVTGLPQRKWPELRDSIADRIQDVSVYDEEIRGFIERARSFRYALSQDLPYGYNHLDLYLDGNIITRDNRIAAILDFDDLQYSPVIVCLGFTLWEVALMNGWETAREYLDLYATRRPLTRTEYETLPQVMLLRNYVIGIVEVHVLKRFTHFLPTALRFEKEIPQMAFGPNLET